jgi:hypothetical protein
MEDPYLNLPPEYQAQIRDLERKRQMAMMLQQQALQQQPTQVIGNRAVKNSPLAGIAQVLSGYLGQKLGSQADTGIAQQLGKYQEAARGEVNRVQSLPEDLAIPAGRSSPYPQAQQLAKAMWEAQQKRNQAGAEILGKAEDVPAAMKALQSGIPTDYTPPQPAPVQFGQQGQAPYAIVPQPNGKRDFHFAPAGISITNDMVGERAVEKAVGAKVPDVVEGARHTIMQAGEALQNASMVAKLAADPEVTTGFGANQALGLKALAAKLGFGGEEGVAKSQALLSGIASQTLAASGELKGAISDKEKPFLEEAKAGRIAYTPAAIQHLAALSAAVNHNRLMAAREQWQGGASVKGAENAAQMWPMPPVNHQLPGPESAYTQLPRGRVQYNGSLVMPQAAPASPAPEQKILTPDQLSPEQKAQLLKLLGGQ